MTKRMLIDATHAEETRVVVLDGNRLEDFDVETSTKRQLKGNIYLAKVVRVEPSLQAAFVEYGGNRHGFLAFSEIHPDYYQIPVADRQRLLDQEAEEAQREEEEVDRELAREHSGGRHGPARSEPSEPSARPWESAEPEIAETTSELEDTAPAAAAAENPADAPAAEQPAAEHPSAERPAEAPDAAPATAADHEAEQPPAAEAARQPSAPDAVSAEQPAAAPQAAATAAETTDESGATPPLAGEPTVTEHPAAAPQPDATAAETTDESGATLPVPSEPPATPASHAEGTHEADEGPHDPPSGRAQPMIIEPETLSGPLESGEPAGDGDLDFFAPRRAVAQDSQPRDATASDTEEAEVSEPPDYYSDSIPEAPPPETVGGEPDSADEQRERRPPSRYLRNYKIQEVIRRRQILLVQVVKEERGTKGAALTTYLSLAGRFSVLMPNSPRGGGISRKITSATDRRRLKEVITELDMPKGMGLIVRTAGANRPKPEIKRDCEYLLRLWDDIREHTLKSVAPALIYEEASLIKRAIRDVYSRDIDEIQVDGEEGWKAAHEFMRMLMPSHAKKVQLWRDPSQPLFTKYQVEAQLDGMLQPTVQLRSGGYLVINQAEALVAIDVNSGRSTRERNVEETALRTNLEAADEVARQLRLRDLAGLIVIDFIDMEVKKHNAMVERRMKEALKNDRARIQVGHISHFGLLEMSRQRLRPSLAEASFILCPHCGGTGHVRSTENAAIHVLRGIEDEGSKRRAAEIVVHAATPIALYILNHKRERLVEIERRYAMRVTVMGDDTQVASQFRIDRMRPQVAREDGLAAITPDAPQPALPAPRYEPEELEEVAAEAESDEEESTAEEDGAEEANGDEQRNGSAEGTPEQQAEQAERRRRRRRRRRGGRREDGPSAAPTEGASSAAPTDAEPEAAAPGGGEPLTGAVAEESSAAEMHIEGVPEHAEPVGEDDARRRRGRRGGRRRRREPGDGESPFAAPGAEQPELPAVYIGPTPANPFGGQAFDIFDVLDQVEASAALRQEPVEPLTRQSPPESGTPTASAEPALVAVTETGAPAASSLSERVATQDAPMAPEASAEPEIVNTTAPEPAQAEPVGDSMAAQPAAPESDAQPATAADAAPAEVANDAAPEPAIRPIIVGSGETPAEKKRGWWRR